MTSLILNNSGKNTAKNVNNQRLEDTFNIFFVPENIFLILALFFGIIFVFLTPPIQVPDEHYHEIKSYATSEFYFWPVQNGDTYGYYFPKSIINFPSVNYPGIAPDSYTSYESILSQISVPLNQNSIDFFQFSNGVYSPIGYIPQAAGMHVGKILNFSPLLLFYCGRLANLGVWIFLVYLAIRKIPFAKWLVVGISLMPMTLFESASLSPDALNNGLCILFIAFVIYCAVNKNSGNPLSNSEILILLIMSIAISLIKGYFPLSLLLFIIPVNAFSSKQKYWFTVLSIILLSILAYILWQILNSSVLSSNLPNDSFHNLMQYILSNPFGYGYVLLTTFYLNGAFYLSTFIGALGWYTIWLPQNIYYIFFLCLIILGIIDNHQKSTLNIKQKTICLIIFAISAGMIATAMLLNGGWGASIISNIQGRYFIGFALLGFIIFNNSHSFNPTIKKIIIISIVAYIVGVLFFALDALCRMYYTSQISPYHLTIILLLINAIILVCCYVHFSSINRLSNSFKINLSSPVFISLLTAIGLSLILFLIIISISNSNLGVSQTSADTIVGPIAGNNTAGQTFYSLYPNLKSIDVLMGRYGLTPTNMNTVTLHLRESPESPNDIVSVTKNAREINYLPNSYYKFEFPKMSDSANKSYYFFIDSPDSIPENAIHIWSSKADLYYHGSEYLNSKPDSGDLTFKVYYAS